jgi:hypothetical protein
MIPTTHRRNITGKLAACTVLSISFAWGEVCVVLYLRKVLGIPPGTGYTGYADWSRNRHEQWVPPHILMALDRNGLLVIERFREVATLVLLGTTGYLVGTNMRTRIAAFAFLFGMWDLAYYVFLVIALHWPTSLTDTDLYFLLPTAMVGPVWFPLLIMPIIAWLGARTIYRWNAVKPSVDPTPALTRDLPTMEHIR